MAAPVAPPQVPTGAKKPPPPPPPRGGVPAAVAKKVRKRKVFHGEEWDSEGQGIKIILYADSGLGKTTLASMLPTPRFIGTDDGGRMIKHPVTGANLNHVPGVETFNDVRDAVTQKDLWDDFKTVVIDTTTIVQDWAEQHVLENIKTEGVNGKYVTRLTDFGWGAGFRHVYDTMHHLLADLDQLVRRGKNVVLVCQLQQSSISNAGGEDFLKDTPKLQNQYGKVCPSVWGLYTEWADHVFRISYQTLFAKDKKAVGSTNRVINTHSEVHFIAKSRTIPSRYPVVLFDSPSDDSIWQCVFDEAWKQWDEEKPT